MDDKITITVDRDALNFTLIAARALTKHTRIGRMTFKAEREMIAEVEAAIAEAEKEKP